MESPFPGLIHNENKDKVLKTLFLEISNLNFLCQDFHSMGYALSNMARNHFSQLDETTDLSGTDYVFDRMKGYEFILDYIKKRMAFVTEGRKQDQYLMQLVNALENTMHAPPPLEVDIANDTGFEEPLEEKEIRERFERLLAKPALNDITREDKGKALLDAAVVCFCLGNDDMRYAGTLDVFADHIALVAANFKTYQATLNEILDDREAKEA